MPSSNARRMLNAMHRVHPRTNVRTDELTKNPAKLSLYAYLSNAGEKRSPIRQRSWSKSRLGALVWTGLCVCAQAGMVRGRARCSGREGMR